MELRKNSTIFFLCLQKITALNRDTLVSMKNWRFVHATDESSALQKCVLRPFHLENLYRFIPMVQTDNFGRLNRCNFTHTICSCSKGPHLRIEGIYFIKGFMFLDMVSYPWIKFPQLYHYYLNQNLINKLLHHLSKLKKELAAHKKGEYLGAYFFAILKEHYWLKRSTQD